MKRECQESNIEILIYSCTQEEDKKHPTPNQQTPRTLTEETILPTGRTTPVIRHMCPSLLEEKKKS